MLHMALCSNNMIIATELVSSKCQNSLAFLYYGIHTKNYNLVESASDLVCKLVTISFQDLQSSKNVHSQKKVVC